MLAAEELRSKNDAVVLACGSTRPRDLPVERRAALPVLALALGLYCLLLVRYVGAVAGGSDSSGYMNHARLLASGRLHMPARTIPGLPQASAPEYLYVPLGFRPARDGDGLVPTYPSGFALFVLAMRPLAGWSTRATSQSSCTRSRGSSPPSPSAGCSAANELNNAKETLKLFLLKSPLDGIFQVAVNEWSDNPQMWKVGDTPYEGQILASIPDVTRMKVKTYINESDVKRVYKGMKVIVRLDALPSVPFNGSISEISKVCVARDKEKVFNIVVVIDESDLRLKPGMTVNCEYILAKDEFALTPQRIQNLPRQGPLVPGANWIHSSASTAVRDSTASAWISRKFCRAAMTLDGVPQPSSSGAPMLSTVLTPERSYATAAPASGAR